MWYEEFDSAEVGTGNVTTRVEYYYQEQRWSAGSPSLIVYKPMDSQTHLPAGYYGTSFAYNKQGEVWMVEDHVWGVDELDELGGVDCWTYQRTRVLEFLGNGRARYGVRQRDPGYFELMLADPTPLWSDYDGDEIYGDYTVDANTGNVIEKTAYLPGIGEMDSQTGAVTYYHADHLGTLRATSDTAGQVVSHLVLTAFGETVAADGTVGTRYQYAGVWGYESGLGSPGHGGSTGQTALPWQHVGHRWYDPSTGRFLQRDPIGIRGGVNVYTYCDNNPLGSVDPHGLWSPFDNERVARITLWLTGGQSCAGAFLDKVGGQIERDRSRRRLALRAGIAAAGARLRKGMPIPGLPGTTSIWTKVPGLSLKTGQTLGRISAPITIAEGTVAGGDIGRGLIAWWYDVELDDEGQVIPFLY